MALKLAELTVDPNRVPPNEDLMKYPHEIYENQ